VRCKTKFLNLLTGGVILAMANAFAAETKEELFQEGVEELSEQTYRGALPRFSPPGARQIFK
jgi:hypothetical protein